MTDPTTTAPAPTRRRRWVAGTVTGAVGVALAAVLGRDLWFFSDDWNILVEYHDGNLLEPFNGHLSAVPAGIYQLLFHTVGLDSYLPYRVCGLIALAVLVFQAVRYAADRMEPARTALVVVGLAVAAIMWNSSGQMNLLFPFLMNFSLPIAALLAIWWHLDRADAATAAGSASATAVRDQGGVEAGGRRHVRHELAASAWLTLALATSGLGLMTLAAVGVELVVRRAPLRRWLVLSPGPVLWAIWYLANRGANDISTEVTSVLSYSARMVLGAFTSIGAGWEPLGWLLALVFLVYLVLAAVRWQSLDARTWGALSAPVVFVLFTAVTRVDIVPAIPPDELRYSWAIAAYLVLAALCAARSRPSLVPDPPPALGPVVASVAAVILVAGLLVLVGDLREWNAKVAAARPGLSTVLYATEAIGADRIAPDVVIPLSYVPVTTGGYLDAVAAVGSPIADIDATGLGGAELDRSFADRLLVQQLPIVLEPSTSGDAGCTTRLRPDSDGWIPLPAGSRVDVRGEGDVVVARFAEGDPQPLGRVQGGAELRLPADAPSAATESIVEDWPYRVSVPEGVDVFGCD